jgi:hypothetical protein
MKQVLLMIALVALVGCETTSKETSTSTSWVSDPSDPNNVIVEKEIRKAAKKPEGKLTKADLEKVRRLYLHYPNPRRPSVKLTEVPKELEKLTKLEVLDLTGNQLTEVPKGLEKFTQLWSLNLGNNQLTDVKGLEKLMQLKILGLANNKLTDVKGLERLRKLQGMNLKDNQLTSVKGLEKLAQGHTHLAALFLQGNPDLTKAQIDELQKVLRLGIVYHEKSK